MSRDSLPESQPVEGDLRRIGWPEALRTWAYIGLNSFGGPAGQIAVMHRVLVEQKRWLSEKRFLHALNYCMLLPGPEATQLATYVGWLLHRTPGGLAAGVLFILPGFVSILALSLVYVTWRDVPAVDAVFHGVGAAVLAIVVEAVVRIGRRALRSVWMTLIAVAAFVAIHFLQAPFPAIVAVAAAIGFLAGRAAPDRLNVAGDVGGDSPTALDLHDDQHTRPTAIAAVRTLATWLPLWFGPQLILAVTRGVDDLYTRIGLFFSKAAVVTFGGAYAVLPYVAQRAVEAYNWLSPEDMLRGLGLAETTPGPLIQVVQFVGFMAAFNHPDDVQPLVAGTLAAVLTAWVTFVPCFLWIFLGAPYVEAARANRSLAVALSGVTAAVVGVVLNLAVWFALHTLFAEVQSHQYGIVRVLVPNWRQVDATALSIAVLSFAALFWWRLGMLRTLALAGGAALALHLVV